MFCAAKYRRNVEQRVFKVAPCTPLAIHEQHLLWGPWKVERIQATNSHYRCADGASVTCPSSSVQLMWRAELVRAFRAWISNRSVYRKLLEVYAFSLR